MEPSAATRQAPARAQDLALFDALYQRHARAVHAYFLGRTGEATRADDLTQETYVRVWKHLAQARAVPEGRRAYWLFAIARNLLTDDYRRSANRAEVASEMPLTSQVETYGAMPTAQGLDLEAAIARLPEPWRLALTMTYVGGLNSEEAGAALDLPAATVRYHLMLARQRLAEILATTQPVQPVREGAR